MASKELTFFAEEDHIKILRRFASFLTQQDVTDPLVREVIDRLAVAVRIISNNPVRFDEGCPENIEWIGRHLLSSIEEILVAQSTELFEQRLFRVFSYVYRVICEYELQLIDKELSTELRSLKSLVHLHLDKFPEEAKSQLVFAEYLMPAQILKREIQHPHIQEIKRFNEVAANVAAQKELWDKEVREKQEQVEALKQALEEYEVGFNFVGLVRAFRDLIEKKNSEKNFAFWSLVALAVLVLLPPLYGVLALRALSVTSVDGTFLYSLIPLATVEIVLIYFFRVVLMHFRSLKAQLLQLELRSALCQFIQSYATYSSEIKRQDASALEKFEHLIFSGVLTNEEHLPATFDGIDQLVKLVKSVRN